MVKVYIAEVSPLTDDFLYRKLYERAPEQEVGCDVEQRAALDPALTEYAMTAEERKRIYSSEDPGEQEEMFFRLWTLKESYMNGRRGHAAGVGVFCDLL